MKYIRILFLIFSTSTLLVSTSIGQTRQTSPALVIFAAASTTTVMTQVCNLFSKKEKKAVKTAFAASSSLAKQIQYGAPADIFISANLKWMDFLEKRQFISIDSRCNLLGNRIVLISPASKPVARLTINHATDLFSLLNGGRLAMGDPDHVPAGIYGKLALENLGLFYAIKKSIAPAKDVRAALVLVEKGETPLGIVYKTDAAISSKVIVSGIFPASSHPLICYPAAIVQGHEKDLAVRFMRFLKTPRIKEIFKSHGFLVYK